MFCHTLLNGGFFTFEFTTDAVPQVLSTALLLFLGLYSLGKPKVPVALPFSFMVLSGAVCSVFYFLELCTNDYSLKLFWAQARFIGLAPLSGFWFAVGVQMTGKPRWLRGRLWWFFAIVPVVTIVLSLTSSYHSWFRYDFTLVRIHDAQVFLYQNGPFFWMYLVYAYGLSVITMGVLLVSLKDWSILRRWPVFLMLVATASFILADVSFQAGITPLSRYRLTPVALALSGVLIAVAVFRFRILDLSPLARSMVMDGISDSILVCDEKGNLTEFNRAAQEIFGLDPRVSLGQRLEGIHPCFRGPCSPDEVVVQVGGVERTFEVDARPILYRGHHLAGTLFQWHEVTQQRKLDREIRMKNALLEEKIQKIEALQAQLQEQVIRDPLTGLFNRRAMDQMLNRDLALAIRTETKLSFVMIDVDLFKTVNDTFGHQIGDLVLKAVADQISQGTRKSDIVCRYGGEEFLLVLYGTSADQAAALAQNIRGAIETMTFLESEKVRVTISAGVATYPDHGDSVEELLQDADQALYAAKRLGRNRVMVAPSP